MKKYILGIFICLFSIFLMSHNANAISTGSFILDTAIGEFRLSLQDGVWDGSAACNENVASGSPIYSKLLFTDWNFSNVTVGNEYLVAFTFFNASNSDSFDGHVPIEIKPYVDDMLWVKQVEIQQVSNSQFVVYMIVEIRLRGNINLWFKSDDWFMLYPNECVGNYGWFTRIQWTGGKDYSSQLNTIINSLSGLNGAMPTPETINNLNNSINNLNNTIEDRNEEEDQALEDATNNAESSGDDSSAEAESATSGLISIIGGFVSAVTNASPSNCNLDGDIGHLDMGILDLCAMPVPSFVQVIGSIILILVCIPFVIIMFNRFISLFRSFQG